MELNNESKTLFIPLYGKAMMSKNNLFINDPKAEEIISKVKFNFEDLKQSKWLSMYMALRAEQVADQAEESDNISNLSVFGKILANQSKENEQDNTEFKVG